MTDGIVNEVNLPDGIDSDLDVNLRVVAIGTEGDGAVRIAYANGEKIIITIDMFRRIAAEVERTLSTDEGEHND